MPRALPPQDDQDLVAPTHLPKVPVEPLSAEHEKNPDLVYDVLADGAARARAVARGVLDRARAACGL